ncbi:MAG TPA: arginine--tRNA ligase, partial [Bacteroidales bacterium]|nr:arginine--tRNA ligase [Bacteroidales bacterium]
LGISFDKIQHESDTYLAGKTIVLKGMEEGHLLSKTDGSVWADLRDEGLDEKLLLRSDGTSVYMTQDLGTAELRFEEFHPSRMIYVVGNEQNYHFDVLKRVLKKLGKPWAEDIFHLSYGMVELPEGKMKSREGTVVDADDLMDEMYSTAEATTRELGKVNDFSEAEAHTLFNQIGLGALKYFILRVDPKKNMLFDPVESIDFNGNTGPFIQYTHARIRSLLRKANDSGQWNEQGMTGANKQDLTLLKPGPQEKQLVKIIYRFPEAVKEAGVTYSPALIANYVYDLAKSFNQFYQEVPVLKEENPELVSLRLLLSFTSAEVIRKCMYLLGIEVPERM